MRDAAVAAGCPGGAWGWRPVTRRAGGSRISPGIVDQSLGPVACQLAVPLLVIVRIRQESVPYQPFKLVCGGQELSQRAAGGTEAQEFLRGQSAFVVGTTKVRELGVKLRDHIRVDRLLHPPYRIHPPAFQPPPPTHRRRDHHGPPPPL